MFDFVLVFHLLLLFLFDKTHEGGNDFEIYNDPRVIGHHVTKYQDLMEILRSM